MAFTRDKQAGSGGGFKRDRLPVVDVGGQIINELKNSVSGINNPQELTDAMRVGIDAFSLGGADYMAGGNQAQLTQEARQRLGLPASIGVDLVGSYLSPTGVPGKLGRGAQILAHGASGGVQSIIDAYTHGERDPWNLAKAGALGSGLSAAGSAIADPIASWWSRRTGREAAKAGQTYKDAAALRADMKNKYKQVEQAGVVYQAQDLKNLAANLRRLNLVPGVDDPAINVLKKLEKDWKGKDMTPDELDKAQRFVRQKLAQAAQGKNAAQIVDQMRNFEKQAPLVTPSKTGIGPAAPAPNTVKDTLLEARDLAARRERLGLVQREENRAQRAARTGRFNPFAPSLESARVKKFGALNQGIEEGKVISKYTPAERKGLTGLEYGTPLRNIGGIAEHLSFSGGLGGPLSALGIPFGLIPGVGQAATVASALTAGGAEILHRLGQNATTKEIEDLGALIRDPAGKGLGGIKADPATVEAAKRKIAKIMSGTARTGSRNAGEQ